MTLDCHHKAPISRFKNKLIAVILGAQYLSLWTGDVFADMEMEEVIVTAQKREENTQTIPLAITALDSEMLEGLGATSYEGVVKATPSIAFTPYAASSNILILYMRGQGVSDPGQITSDGAVGLYANGFYIARPQASTFDLADVERVEVLRGPQGTLYGRNTTGGAVNIISKDPTGEFGFKQNFSFGTRDLFRSLTTINLPSAHDVATKLTIIKKSIDGYVKNSGNTHDYGEEEQLAGRFALTWTPSDTFSVSYFMEKGNLDSTPIYYQNSAFNGMTITVPKGYPNGQAITATDSFALGNSALYLYTSPNGHAPSHTYRSIELPLSTSDFEGHGLTLNWDLNDSISIKSLTGYRKLNWLAFQDYADSFAYINTYATPLTGTPVSFASRDEVHSHQFSQEFQIVGSTFDDRVEYLGGLYFFDESGSHLHDITQAVGLINLASNAITDIDAEATSKAIYGQAIWTPPIANDQLSFTIGGRYTKDRRKGVRTLEQTQIYAGTVLKDHFLAEDGTEAMGSINDKSYSRFNPTVTVKYELSPDVSTYMKWATGYKAGGSSETAPPGKFNLTYGPEKVNTYEFGVKSYWLDHVLRMNVAVFESKFDDMQLAFIADSADISQILGYNAGKASIKGAEIETMLVPTDDLSIMLSYTYLNGSMDEVGAKAGSLFDPATNPSSPYQVGENIKGLFSLPYVSKHAAQFGADYIFAHLTGSSLSIHIDYKFQSSYFASAPTGPDIANNDYSKIPSYGVINGRVTWAFDLPRGDDAKLSLWGKNLAGKDYPVHVIANGSPIEAAGGTPAGYSSTTKAWAEPPAFGIDLSYEY